MNTEQKLGLTPIYLRLAASYLTRGEGTYKCEFFKYDTVKVRVDQSWNNYALKDDPPAYFMVTRVEFFRAGQMMKWVEFKSTMTGGGSRESNFQVLEPVGDS